MSLADLSSDYWEIIIAHYMEGNRYIPRPPDIMKLLLISPDLYNNIIDTDKLSILKKIIQTKEKRDNNYFFGRCSNCYISIATKKLFTFDKKYKGEIRHIRMMCYQCDFCNKKWMWIRITRTNMSSNLPHFVKKFPPQSFYNEMDKKLSNQNFFPSYSPYTLLNKYYRE